MAALLHALVLRLLGITDELLDATETHLRAVAEATR